MTTPTQKQLDTLDLINIRIQKRVDEFKANVSHEKAKIALYIEQKTGKEINPEKITEADIDALVTDFENKALNDILDKYDDKLI